MKTELTAVFTVQERDDDNDLIEVEFTEATAELRWHEWRAEGNGGKTTERRISLSHGQVQQIFLAQERYLKMRVAAMNIAGGK